MLNKGQILIIKIFDRFKLSESKINDLITKIEAEQAMTTK